MSRIATTLVFMTATVLSVAGCHREKPEVEEEAKYAATTPLRKDTELTREYVAQIRAIQHIELRALEKGYLTGVFVDEGQLVPAGKMMFQILPMIYQAEVKKAQAEADMTEIELNNTKILADKNVVSPNELSLINAKYNKAKAEVALASTHKSLTEIHAPFNGIMGRFNVRLGSLVAEGDLLTTLSDNSTMWVYFNVSEAEYLRYKEQNQTNEPTPVKLVMANGEVFDQPGKVSTIEADFNNGTGNLAFRATFPNPKGLLRHGETGKVLMTTVQRNALVIPQKATFDVLDHKYVYVVDDKGIVHSKPITVGASLTHVFIVDSGLDEKDKVLIDGLRKVHDGSKVAIDFKPPPEVLGHLDVPAE
jgi:membrane fusion protein (multidrug efflux system)